MINRFTYINEKVPHDEPVFILRAQDNHAADLVEKWAHFARVSGAPEDKVREALQIAQEMRDWPVHKFPD